MSWFLCVILALLSGAIGLVLGGLVMVGCIKWFEISSFEGKAGFGLVGAALLGGIAGLVVGLVVALSMPHGVPLPFLRALGLSLGILIVLAALAAGIARMLADVPPTLDGSELVLELEIRLPVGRAERPSYPLEEAILELGALRGKVRRAAVRGVLQLDEARYEDGRWILPAWAEVFTGRGKRLLSVELGKEPIFGFLVPLPGRPRRTHLAWSGWEPKPRRGEPPLADTEPSFRFRVKRVDDYEPEEDAS